MPIVIYTIYLIKEKINITTFLSDLNSDIGRFK